MRCKSMVKKPQKIFVAKEDRVRNLKSLLDTYLGVFKGLETKDQIIRSFRFETNAAFINLYERKTERIAKFVEELKEFFFVGETYFNPEPKKSNLFGAIIVSRFKDLLDVGTYNAKKYKGQFEKVPDLSWVLFGTPFKKEYPSQELIKELETVLDYYRDKQDIFIDFYSVRDILEALKSEKPVTSLELTSKKPQVVKTFIEILKEFFTVSQDCSDPELREYGFTGEIFVSHYKNLLDIIRYYSDKNEGVFERFAGLAGVLLLNLEKHPPGNIAYYCFDEELKKYNFIK